MINNIYIPTLWQDQQSSTFIPILPLNGATNNKQFKSDIKQSRRRVVHQRSKTRVDSNFTQYEFLFKQNFIVNTFTFIKLGQLPKFNLISARSCSLLGW